jgi:predicted flap endonuclease-1-like 5' DNA nuclease
MTIQLKPETEAAIAARAYQYWEDEGRPHGRHEIHWQRAYDAIVNIKMQPVASAAAPAVADDVSLIDGIGPKITKQLAAEGIVALSQIANLTPAALAKLDTKLGFKGRTVREEWIAQAKELLAGKAPRAKVDQARAK